MNYPLTTEFVDAMVLELKAYLTLCEEVLSLTIRENQALASEASYEATEFNKKRQTLLPHIDSLLTRLRARRQIWQQVAASERERCHEVKTLFHGIQNLLMKVLTLDRENQQAMLKRGLVPTRHLPSAPVRKPNYVASVYRQNAAVHA